MALLYLKKKKRLISNYSLHAYYLTSMNSLQAHTVKDRCNMPIHMAFYGQLAAENSCYPHVRYPYLQQVCGNSIVATARQRHEGRTQEWVMFQSSRLILHLFSSGNACNWKNKSHPLESTAFECGAWVLQRMGGSVGSQANGSPLQKISPRRLHNKRSDIYRSMLHPLPESEELLSS